MKPNFELLPAQTEGTPCLYHHGLGSPEGIAGQMREKLESYGLSVNALERDDEAIFSTINPAEDLIEGALTACKHLAKKTQQKVILVGNSLGSYAAIITALRAQDSVRAVLATDAFLEPKYGMGQIERDMHQMHEVVGAAIKSGKHVETPWSQTLEKFKEAGSTNYPVLLTGDRWMNLPRDVAQLFEDLTAFDVNQLQVPTHLIWGKDDHLIKTQPHLIMPQATFHVGEFGHNDWKQDAESIASAETFLSTQTKV